MNVIYKSAHDRRKEQEQLDAKRRADRESLIPTSQREIERLKAES